MLSLRKQNQQHMKKTLLLACTIISFAIISHAQIKKGSILLGGSLGISRNSEETNSVESQTRNTYFSPTVGVAIKDNWVAGITTSFRVMKADQVLLHITTR
jgi:hypothetical protein